MGEYLLVSTTAGSRESAADLLRFAVKERLAASGQVFGPVLSAFWHLGTFGEGEEWQLLLKTTAAEVTAFRIQDGSAPYLEWITRATSPE